MVVREFNLLIMNVIISHYTNINSAYYNSNLIYIKYIVIELT